MSGEEEDVSALESWVPSDADGHREDLRRLVPQLPRALRVPGEVLLSNLDAVASIVALGRCGPASGPEGRAPAARDAQRLAVVLLWETFEGLASEVLLAFAGSRSTAAWVTSVLADAGGPPDGARRDLGRLVSVPASRILAGLRWLAWALLPEAGGLHAALEDGRIDAIARHRDQLVRPAAATSLADRVSAARDRPAPVADVRPAIEAVARAGSELLRAGEAALAATDARSTTARE